MMPIVNRKQLEDLYRNMSSAICSVPNLLLVDRSIVIDRVRLVEDEIEGRCLQTPEQLSFDGVLLDSWIPLTGRLVEHFTKPVILSERDPNWEYRVDPAQHIYVCNWCSNSTTFSNEREARRAGWTSVEDPVGNCWDFCPESDCQDGCARYAEAMIDIKRAKESVQLQ